MDLMRYIPKEFKPFVVDIYEGNEEFNEVTGRSARELVVEWQNGERSVFANKTWAFKCLREVHFVEEFKEVEK
jgi:hypothetical protein